MADKSFYTVILPKITYWAYNIWCATFNFSFVNAEPLFHIWDSGKSFILALWHDELFPAIFAPKRIGKFSLITMASQSSDGEFISSVLKRLGYEVARGSSSRGGLKALLHIAHAMQKKKICPAITVDGPRGPRHQVKEGIIFLAQRAGVPIIPMRCHASRKKIFLKSWDKFQLPLPFSKVEVVFGDPVCIPPGALGSEQLENFRLHIQNTLSLMSGHE